MSWGEASRLTRELLREPGSHVYAAVNDWEYPVSREALVLMDLHDAFVNANFKRAKAYPRPWKDRSKTRPKPTVPQHVVIEALRRAGHKGPLPAPAA